MSIALNLIRQHKLGKIGVKKKLSRSSADSRCFPPRVVEPLEKGLRGFICGPAN